jgi:RNA polymerase sigma-70 factor (ECF subfamily)
MTYTEIAHELGVSVSSVEKYILQALKQCRQELVSYYREGEP